MIAELERRIVEEWNRLDLATICHTIDDLKITMEVVIDADGDFVTSVEKRRYKH